MSGFHGGVQATAKNTNKKAIFNGCWSHTLNLWGQHSFAQITSCVAFFGNLEAMYLFFATSFHRWGVLTEHSDVIIRWSARHDAVNQLTKR